MLQAVQRSPTSSLKAGIKITNIDFLYNVVGGDTDFTMYVAENCNEDNARWDYKIVNNIGRYTKYKKLNGRILLKFLHKNVQNSYHCGFDETLKQKLCQHVKYDTSFEISGYFVEGILHGKVTASLEDGTVLVGMANNSMILPPFRYLQKQQTHF